MSSHFKPLIICTTLCIAVMILCRIPQYYTLKGAPKAKSSSSVVLSSKPMRSLPFRTAKWKNLTKTLWPDDPQCSSYQVQFGFNMPDAYLVTFPRSGTHWTRYLLEASSGLFTGSVYRSSSNFKRGYLGEQAPDWYTLITKNHLLGSGKTYFKRKEEIKSYTPVITVVRNPTDSIISLFNFINTQSSHFKNVSKELYRDKGFRRYVAIKQLLWENTYVDRLTWSENLLVVVYEDIKRDPIAMVKKMLKFLAIRIPSEERMACLLKYIDGTMKGSQREIDPYTAEEKIKFGQIVSRVNYFMKLRGFSPLKFEKIQNFTVSENPKDNADIILSSERIKQAKEARILMEKMAKYKKET